MNDEYQDKARRDFVELVLEYPEWQYIIEFKSRRERITSKRFCPEHLPPHERRSHRRPQGVARESLTHVAPLRTRLETRTIGYHKLDALEQSSRIETTFLKHLRSVQRGRVAAFWCVEDYHDKAAHPCLLVGHLKVETGDVNWRQEFREAADASGLSLLRVTPWELQWKGTRGLARYLMKSLYPSAFKNPEYLLATSSGAWGMTGFIPELFKPLGELHDYASD